MKLYLYSHFFIFAVTSATFASSQPYKGSSFQKVWQAIQPKEGEGESIPTAKLTKVLDFGIVDHLLGRAAKRTIEEQFDLFEESNGYPPKRKLLHPHGICYRGSWEITESTNFTGQFAKNTRSAIIVRGSEALGYVNRGNRRAFGIAGKIFPGIDPKISEDSGKNEVKTANFFTVDDLGGTEIPEFLNSSFTNEPPVTIDAFTSPNALAVALYIAKIFPGIDKKFGIRQLYPLSESGLSDVGTAVTPTHVRLTGGDFGRIASIKDFRLESRVENYSEPIVLSIELRAGPVDEWVRSGELKLTQSVISTACDEKLHFHHPKWKD